MAKILLVEDDNNLREIYEARLMAEGYDIVTAPDGEAALAIASKERPDLVISDVMMPNISGFDMLDIMRNTNGLKNVKVIMLTALSQAEDQARAAALGADRYLVKSQVTLEDIVNNAKALLGDGAGAAQPALDVVATPPEPAVVDTPVAAPPVVDTPVASPPAPDDTAAATTAAPVEETAPAEATPEPAVAPEPVTEPAPAPEATPEPVSQEVAPEPAPAAETPEPEAEPTTTPEPSTEAPAAPITETAPEVPAPEPATPTASEPTAEQVAAATDLSESSAQESAEVQKQIDSFMSDMTTAPAEPAPAPEAEATPEPVGQEVAPEPAPAETPEPEATPAPEAVVVAPLTPETQTPTEQAPVSAEQSNDQVLSNAVDQLNAGVAESQPAPAEPTAETPEPTAAAPEPKPETGGVKVIQPIEPDEKKPDLNELLAREAAKQQAGTPGGTVNPDNLRPEDIAL